MSRPDPAGSLFFAELHLKKYSQLHKVIRTYAYAMSTICGLWVRKDAIQDLVRMFIHFPGLADEPWMYYLTKPGKRDKICAHSSSCLLFHPWSSQLPPRVHRKGHTYSITPMFLSGCEEQQPTFFFFSLLPQKVGLTMDPNWVH